MLHETTKESVVAAVKSLNGLSALSRRTGINKGVFSLVLHHENPPISRQMEGRIRLALGLPPLPAPVPVDPCPDCGSVHHARCNGNSGPVVVLAATERVVKAGRGRKRRRLVRPVATEAQNSRRLALGAGWREIINAGLDALERNKQ